MYRITPAYAGKSSRGASDLSRSEDHPRIRGKKKKSSDCQLQKLGSPPHTREKVFPIFWIISSKGITPAYAGKSSQLNLCKGGTRDHPRIRGKKQFNMCRFRKCQGSPPHTREKARFFD
ncbi:hypothetical protein HMPREF3187_01273 [Aerococcus christensenii]|uniref:Uncharacterized protein n=1 Tax=Aerococcus christensenii TaxID=87541 RepID=A0A133XUL8_9LACT|nr:hypothetical protein HMPREF3187_01273 [Aerococcus christensenii]